MSPEPERGRPPAGRWRRAYTAALLTLVATLLLLRAFSSYFSG